MQFHWFAIAECWNALFREVGRKRRKKSHMDTKELFCCPSGKSSLLELVWDGAPGSLDITCVKHEKGIYVTSLPCYSRRSHYLHSYHTVIAPDGRKLKLRSLVHEVTVAAISISALVPLLWN